MKTLLAVLLLALTACAPERARQVVEIPTYTSPCTMGATCPNGSDLDPKHDHTEEWQALTCQDACRILLQDNTAGFDDVFACEPMRKDEGFWVVTCDYEYTPTNDEPM